MLQVLDAALSAQTVGLVTQEQYKRKLAQLQEEGVPTEAPKVSTCCLTATSPRHMWLWGRVRHSCLWPADAHSPSFKVCGVGCAAAVW